MPQPLICDFCDGSADMADLLGGKGANLAAMTKLLGPEAVPPGFTVTTEACRAFLNSGDISESGLDQQIAQAVQRLEVQTGLKFGGAENPLLVSVRSGARVSMPGMMDTVLNVGISSRNLGGLADWCGPLGERFALDAYRRLISMYSVVVAGASPDRFESILKAERSAAVAVEDSQLTAEALHRVVDRFKAIHFDLTSKPFPEDPTEQLLSAVAAVFASWNSKRAIEYRRIHGLPSSWGTAVNVQLMVFGNLGPDSGSGVAFSRDAITGTPTPSGDFLADAQGEDVVSGSRDPVDLHLLAELLPDAHSKLRDCLQALEREFGDIQDTEFTIQRGRLFVLQTRTAQRPAIASVRFACDAVDEQLLTVNSALMTLVPGQLNELLLPTLSRPISQSEELARGVAASPGAASGELVFTAEAAVAAAAEGRDVILARRHTDASDVAGFHAARGIITATGGKASHAALVARGMGRPCVCGVSGIEINEANGWLRSDSDGTLLREGDRILIDGTNGIITSTEIPLNEGVLDDRAERVLDWADSRRRLGIRANADSPEDAVRSISLGAEAIGLCRTEHMFMAPERQRLMRRMILSDTTDERHGVLELLLPLQREDFEGIFKAMDGRAVTVRLLDPPLHEFLRDPVELERLAAEHRLHDGAGGVAAELERTLQLRESNPMLGTRGVRLGLLYPEIYEMQVRAIAQAALATAARGTKPMIEIMLPLIGWAAELEASRDLVCRTASSEGLIEGRDFTVGAMIELPRACLESASLAEQSSFLSYGTNDLTQTSLGLSRDDTEATIVRHYEDLGIIDGSPFETLDRKGVGELIKISSSRARVANPNIELGVCGEHGGDPSSIDFFDELGLDYVSCSPYRLPTARVAAAQSAIGRPTGDPK